MDYLMVLTIVTYLLASVAYLLYLFLQKNRLQVAGNLLMAAGFGFQLVMILLTFIRSGLFPAHNLHATLMVASCALCGVFLGIQYRYNLKVLGIYTAPLVTAVVIVAAFLPQGTGVPSQLFKSFWMVIHVVTVFSGDAAFALACGLGILYLIQEKAIKSKRHGFFFRRLPSLDLLDSAGYACIVTGFCLMSIGMVSGFIFAKTVWGRFFAWDPKEVWSCITWLVYAVLIHERIAFGWRGRKAAILSIVGFALLLFTFFGVNFLMEGHHGEFTRIG
jgi:cytochrome c-type biogenesis protein CcsB